MPKGGRPRQLCSRTVLLGVMLALDSGRPAHLEAAHRALSWLSVPDQLALQVIGGGRRHVATYRQFEDTFSVMCRLIDPSPVPSFQGVAEPARRGPSLPGGPRRREGGLRAPPPPRRRPLGGERARGLQESLEIACCRLDRP